jgi:homoserine dehydrogenase
MFYGKGAGELPTASSAVGDILLIANALQQEQGRLAGMDFQCDKTATYTPIKDTTNAYYIRVETNDESGVIGHLGKACGDNNVSLDAIMQKGTKAADNSATIVLLTHDVSEADMQAALSDIRGLSSIRHVHTVLRVFAS